MDSTSQKFFGDRLDPTFQRIFHEEIQDAPSPAPTTIFEKLTWDLDKCRKIREEMQAVLDAVKGVDDTIKEMIDPPEVESRTLVSDLDTLAVLLDTIECYVGMVQKELG